MYRSTLLLSLPAGLLAVGLLGCVTTEEGSLNSAMETRGFQAKQEIVPDFGALIPETGQEGRDLITFDALERVSTGVPWPRGLAFVDDELIVLARGRHRNAGGVDHGIEDFTGSLFRVNLDLAEPVVVGELASIGVKQNARILTGPSPEVFNLPDTAKNPFDDGLMDRPYCTLVYDEQSQNLIICGYSGVDLPGRKFRKNATDSVHRFDMRLNQWFPVEMHDADSVPFDELGYVVSDEYYPHHDVSRNAAPHGWINGPDGCLVVGDFLYVAAKDNHRLVQYDWAEVIADGSTTYPESRPVLGARVRVSSPMGVKEMDVAGPSALTLRDGYMYVGYRTASVVLRFPLQENGDFVQPADGGLPVGELIAAFEPWDAERGRSANLIDLTFGPDGRLFASTASEGKIWCIGQPDPARPFYGNDQTDRQPTAPPALRLADLTGKPSRTGNIQFDDEGRLYICSGNYDSDSTVLAGVIYRASN
ncbi:MAG: hypothetical protein ACI8QS_000298 [Planctomycetota bacterium]|jgi:hypothetical protein